MNSISFLFLCHLLVIILIYIFISFTITVTERNTQCCQLSNFKSSNTQNMMRILVKICIVPKIFLVHLNLLGLCHYMQSSQLSRINHFFKYLYCSSWVEPRYLKLFPSTTTINDIYSSWWTTFYPSLLFTKL